MAEVASFLMRHAGVFGARVEGLRVFSREGKEASAEAEEKEVEKAQEKWPETTLELLQAAEGRRRLKVRHQTHTTI